MAEAFNFRNRLAHGKSIINEKVKRQPLGQHLHPEWLKKYESLETAKAMLDDLDSALRTLASAAGLDPILTGFIAVSEPDAEEEAEGPAS